MNETKIIFYSCRNTPHATVSTRVKGITPVYEEIVDSKGITKLRKTGEHNLNEFVQVSADSCDVYKILDRFERGDVDALTKVKGFYADVTSMPKSLLEVHNFMSSLENRFNDLDPKVKQKFGNSPKKFMASIENGEFTQIFKDLNEAIAPAKPQNIGENNHKEGDK